MTIKGDKRAPLALSGPLPTAAVNTVNHRDFTDSEVSTILHGLRTLQAEGRIEGCAAGDCDHFDNAEELTHAQIDDLCERINLGDFDQPEDYWKCANCDHSKEEHKGHKCTKCDCTAWRLDPAHTEPEPTPSGSDQSKTWTPNPDECVRLCEALAAFWGDGVCDAPIHPGAYLTEEDTPIRDLIRAAVGWRKP